MPYSHVPLPSVLAGQWLRALVDLVHIVLILARVKYFYFDSPIFFPGLAVKKVCKNDSLLIF